MLIFFVKQYVNSCIYQVVRTELEKLLWVTWVSLFHCEPFKVKLYLILIASLMIGLTLNYTTNSVNYHLELCEPQDQALALKRVNQPNHLGHLVLLDVALSQGEHLESIPEFGGRRKGDNLLSETRRSALKLQDTRWELLGRGGGGCGRLQFSFSHYIQELLFIVDSHF